MGGVVSVLVWCLATYLLLVGQMAICPAVAVGPFLPNLFVALLLPCIVCRSYRSAIMGAAGWGLAADCLGTGPLGVNLISFTLVASFVTRRTEHKTAGSSAVTVLWMALSIVALLAIDLVATWPLEKMMTQWNGVCVLLAGTSLYTLMVGLGWMTMVAIVHRLTGHSQRNRSVASISRRPAVGW